MAYPMTPTLLAAIERQAREQAAGHRAGSEKARQLVAILDLLRAAEAERDRLRELLGRERGAAQSETDGLARDDGHCQHTRYQFVGQCNVGCCTDYRCLDCGHVWSVEEPD